ncbi:hypothetical protein I551_4552 [Mycobacterium ulcerans str. Harvey]|uniref:Uncharacterized protein n=1 Tax=Mycobacterium ulcerans str. Harvey TaxID=1299332 RepID=A0ABN0QVV2_MYCUL|nr:hypothetical protein I551_4552 [Mycobacterium ulcerans str. Harvey]
MGSNVGRWAAILLLASTAGVAMAGRYHRRELSGANRHHDFYVHTADSQ